MRWTLLLMLSAAAWSQQYAVDWPKLQPEVLKRFSALLRINTSNPPGNESKAASAIAAMLREEGIAAQTFALEPGRASLVARIRGNGRKRPVLLMGHTDVVGVQREKWAVDPFAAFMKDGVIRARGASDDKDSVVAGIMVLLQLKRLRVPLDRDVIFLAEAGEEGTSQVGIGFMVAQHWKEIEAEFALAEGGAILEDGGKVSHVIVSTTEKVPREVTLTAHGQAGHGSRPLMQNAVVHLAQAVARVGTWESPMRLNQTTRAYFERLAAISPPEQAARFRAVLDPARAAQADRYFRANDPGHYSVLRTSVVPTILNAGFRLNVIPSEAKATLDVRALPDEDMKALMNAMRKVIGDPSVEVALKEPGGRPAAPPSRLDSEMFRALEAVGKRMFNAPTLPSMLTGATDNAQLRAKGVQAYGIGGMVSVAEGPVGSAHSDDEHISVKGLMALVEYTWNAVVEVAASK